MKTMIFGIQLMILGGIIHVAYGHVFEGAIVHGDLEIPIIIGVIMSLFGLVCKRKISKSEGLGARKSGSALVSP